MEIKELRRIFNYYRRQLEKKIAMESELHKAIHKVEIEPETTFKKFSFDEVYEKGVSRKNPRTGRTEKYFGEEAVRIQIQSFKRRASAQYMRNTFQKNYVKAMRDNGYSEESIRYFETRMRGVSTRVLTYLLREGRFPDIYFLYTTSKNPMLNELFMEELNNALGISPGGGMAKEVTKVRQQRIRAEANEAFAEANIGMQIRKQRKIFKGASTELQKQGQTFKETKTRETQILQDRFSGKT